MALLDQKKANPLYDCYDYLCRFLGLPQPPKSQEEEDEEKVVSMGSDGEQEGPVGDDVQEKEEDGEEEEEVTALPRAMLSAFSEWLLRNNQVRPSTMNEYQNHAEITIREMLEEANGGDATFQPFPSRVEVRHGHGRKQQLGL